MPRKRRKESPTGIYHWITRGINKKDLFHNEDDYDHFIGLLKQYKDLYSILIYHYCFMKNHIHMLIQSPSVHDMATFTQYVHRRYAYYYCAKYHWSGSIFQRGYRSIPVDKETYLLGCGRYIERNPVNAGLCKDPAEYARSSYAFYSRGQDNDFVDPSPAYMALSESEESRMAIYTEIVTQPNIAEEAPKMKEMAF